MEKDTLKYCKEIKEYIYKEYRKHFHEPVEGFLKYPSFTSGINYVTQVWDWGSWQCTIAMNQIDDPDLERFQKGNVLNFLDHQTEAGRIPIVVATIDNSFWLPDLNDLENGNMSKPVIAIHALEVSKRYNDVEWIRPFFDKILHFNKFYEEHQKHEETGLFFFNDDLAVGVDNDPAIFYRPNKSTGFLLINCLMYKELLSISELGKLLGKEDIASEYSIKAEELKQAVRNECFDPVDGYFYSADISLRKIDKNEWRHSGSPRIWKSLPIKITTWLGMFPLWCGIATKEQAEKCVKHYLNPESLYAPYGIRSLGKNEKMYALLDTGNPSCWWGPAWINANYFTYVGLKNYGYTELANELAIKTINLLGKSLEEKGGFYEYYDPDTGEGIRGLGMHGWNFLALNLINDLEKDK